MSATTELGYIGIINSLVKKKRLFIFTALTVMSIGAIVVYLLPNKYEANSTVFIEKSVISELVRGIAVTPSVDDKVKALTYTMNSRALLQKVISDIDINKSSEAENDKLIKKIQNNIQIKVKDKEGLFIVSFQDENPRTARDFVNTIVRKYIEENVSSKRGDSYGATQFLSEQIGSFKEKLDKAEEKVNDFKRTRGSLLSSDPSVLQKEINDSQQRTDDLRIKRSQLETTYASLIKNSPLQAKLGALKKRLDELKVDYTDNYPDVVKVKAEIAGIQDQINSNRSAYSPGDTLEADKVAMEIKAIRQAEDNLRMHIARNRQLMQSIPDARASLEDLEREKSSHKSMYDQLVARHGQSEVSKQVEVQDKAMNFRIVDPATLPTRPVSPNRLLLIAMSIFIGIVTGLGVIIGLDSLDHTVKDLTSIKSLGLPVLAVIPKIVTAAEQELQKKRDFRLYLFTGSYFGLFLMIMACEAVGINIIENLVSRFR